MNPANDVSFALPDSLSRPLWQSLAGNLRDRLIPERQPPLQLTSRPVDVGMLMGDFLALPWYRTVFTNLGDVISPEVLPPLQLESRPIEVDELLSDNLSHMWWSSLLRNVADAVAPEKLPVLPLTAAPVNASLRSGSMQLMRWSSLASWPKVTRPQAATIAPSQSAQPSATARPQINFGAVLSTPAPKPQPSQTHLHGHKLKNKLGRSRMREGIWISIATAEIIYLLITWVGPHWTGR